MHAISRESPPPEASRAEPPPADDRDGRTVGDGREREGGAEAVAFGRRLRARRTQLGLTQAALAGSTISKGLVSLMESGRREPSIRTLTFLAERLECSPADLLTDEVPAPPPALRLVRAEIALRAGAPDRALAAFDALRSPGADRRSGRSGGRAATGRGPRRDPLTNGSDGSGGPGPSAGSAGSAGSAARVAVGRGQALEALGRHDEAIEALEAERDRAAAAGEPPWLALDTSLALCHLASGRFAAGEALVRATLAAVDADGLAGTADHARLATALIELAVALRRPDLAAREAAARLRDPLAVPRPGHAARLADASERVEAAGRMGEATLLAERAAAAYADEVDLRAGARLKLVAGAALLDTAPADPAVDPAAVEVGRRVDVDLVVSQLGLARDVFAAVGSPADVADCDRTIDRAHRRAGGVGRG